MRIERNNTERPIELVQITDSHLGGQPGEELLGMDTDQSLAHVIDLIEAERPSAELLLATGDISNGGSPASYLRFQQLTGHLAPHILWLPGNHDALPAMQQTFAGDPALGRNIEVGNWQIIMLNSATPGEVGGNFSAGELEFLQHCLETTEAEHVLLCMHHHPIPIGCDWLDGQQVRNAEAFFALVDQFSSVRGILWGHIHQELDQQRNNVSLMATPSSCIQFAANSPDFKLARLNPGYRWLSLHADGAIDTGISRVTGVEFDIDYEHSSGY